VESNTYAVLLRDIFQKSHVRKDYLHILITYTFYLIYLHFYLYLQTAYKFVINAHESSHVPEGISFKTKTHFDLKKKMFTFKWRSCEVVMHDIHLVS
jgi:hypothetical protein